MHLASKPSTLATKPTAIHSEVVHTTANQPWLSADHGWQIASFLRVDEPVRRADGSTAVVASVRSVAGTADMWDLTVASVHTFAVGRGTFVVHNCSAGNEPPRTYEPSPKHELGGWGSPMDLDPSTAQDVLDDGVMHPNGKSIWNVNNRSLYIFRQTNEVTNTWHGYRVVEDGLVRARQQAGGALWREMLRRGLDF